MTFLFTGLGEKAQHRLVIPPREVFLLQDWETSFLCPILPPGRCKWHPEPVMDYAGQTLRMSLPPRVTSWVRGNRKTKSPTLQVSVYSGICFMRKDQSTTQPSAVNASVRVELP